MGSILASAAFAIFFHWIGWRGLFILGAAPALLVFYVQARVDESPVWLEGAKKRRRAGRRELLAGEAGTWARLAGFSAYVSISGAADDGIHELLAWDAGRVSDVSCG